MNWLEKNTKPITVGMIVLEGSLIMVIELLVGKYIEAYFGTMLTAWTTTLGLTLLGVSIGYYLGGRYSVYAKAVSFLSIPFLGASIALLFAILLLPYSVKLLAATENLHLSLIITGTIGLVFPLVFLGAIPPIIIQLITKNEAQSGESTGIVYSISAITGVFSTLITGFYIIENFGIFYPLVFTSVLLFIIGSFLFLLRAKRSTIISLSIAYFIGLAFIVNNRLELQPINANSTIVHQEEGMLGQVKITDFPLDQNNTAFHRVLNINNIPQSIVIGGDQAATSAYKYVHLVSSILTSHPKGSNILLCGLAAGSLVSELNRLGMNVEVVDIDPRMKTIAEDYFNIDSSTYKFTEDDARHFIMATDKKYDVIIIDISASESQPTYLYTIESFKKIHETLNENGTLIVNFQSTFSESPMNAGNLIFQTIHHADFSVKGIVINKEIKDDIIYIGKKGSPFSFEDIDYNRMNICCIQNQFVQDYIMKKVFVRPKIISPPVYLCDDKPLLESLKNQTLVKNRTKSAKTYK